MEAKLINNEYYIRLEKGEQLMAEIRNFVTEHHLCGHFSGIGACDEVVISTYIPEKNDFIDHVKKGMFELFTLTGNVSLDKDKSPVVHAHAGFSYLDQTGEIATFAGDLREATINYTVELVFTPANQEILRQFDSAAGIDVWKLN
jgi:predicted DNA-binding protein with PD1-like motif